MEEADLTLNNLWLISVMSSSGIRIISGQLLMSNCTSFIPNCSSFMCTPSQDLTVGPLVAIIDLKNDLIIIVSIILDLASKSLLNFRLALCLPFMEELIEGDSSINLTPSNQRQMMFNFKGASLLTLSFMLSSPEVVFRLLDAKYLFKFRLSNPPEQHRSL